MKHNLNSKIESIYWLHTCNTDETGSGNHNKQNFELVKGVFMLQYFCDPLTKKNSIWEFYSQEVAYGRNEKLDC